MLWAMGGLVLLLGYITYLAVMDQKREYIRYREIVLLSFLWQCVVLLIVLAFYP